MNTQKSSDLEQEVKELTDQVKRLKEAGNVLPEDLVKRAENAELTAKLQTISGGKKWLKLHNGNTK